MNKSRLVLLLHLIGERLAQSQSEVINFAMPDHFRHSFENCSDKAHIRLTCRTYLV